MALHCHPELSNNWKCQRPRAFTNHRNAMRYISDFSVYVNLVMRLTMKVILIEFPEHYGFACDKDIQ